LVELLALVGVVGWWVGFFFLSCRWLLLVLECW
jgi:hypothetical protein